MIPDEIDGQDAAALPPLTLCDCNQRVEVSRGPPLLRSAEVEVEINFCLCSAGCPRGFGYGVGVGVVC